MLAMHVIIIQLSHNLYQIKTEVLGHFYYAVAIWNKGPRGNHPACWCRIHITATIDYLSYTTVAF